MNLNEIADRLEAYLLKVDQHSDGPLNGCLLCEEKNAILRDLRAADEKATILGNIRDCEEAFISYSEIPQYDAKELRRKLIITGPARLLLPMMKELTAAALEKEK